MDLLNEVRLEHAHTFCGRALSVPRQKGSQDWAVNPMSSIQ